MSSYSSSSSVETIEFLILKTEIPSHWFMLLKRVWNDGLFLLNWLQYYKKYEQYQQMHPAEIKVRKEGDIWIPYCEISRQVRKNFKKSWNKENLEVRFCCNIVNPKWATPPPIQQFTDIDLRKCFAKKRCDWLKDSDIPSVYVNDFIGLVLIPAWEAYQKQVRKKPKYRKQKVTAIVSASFRSQCSFLGENIIKVPGLELEVRDLRQRLLAPIDKMVEKMRDNPSDFPQLEKKINDIQRQSLQKLIKESGEDKKNLLPSQIAKYESQIDKDKTFEAAIAYFSKPGSFKIINRDGKNYLQITATMPATITPTTKEVGVDVGLDYLIHSTSGLKVKHQDFLAELARIDKLNSRLAKMEYGSRNYQKMLAKISRLQGKISRSKRMRQAFYAQQIADVNQFVALKKINIQAATANPLPRFSAEEDKYLPNGKSEASIRNRELYDCALGQFVTKLSQQCHKLQRQLVVVDIEPEATPEEVLQVAHESEESNPSSVFAKSKSAQNLDHSGTREDLSVMTIATVGKSKSTNRRHATIAIESIANPPVPIVAANKKRNRRKERIIG
jgi:transposase